MHPRIWNPFRCLASSGQHCIGRPPMTVNSYKILGYGPVLIYYIARPDESEEEARDAHFSFEVKRGWAPMLFTTAATFTKIVYEGGEKTAPVFVPARVDVHVYGEKCEVFLCGDCTVVSHCDKPVSYTEGSARLPSGSFACIFTADPCHIDEDIVAIIKSDSRVHCAGAQTIHLYSGDTVLYRNE